MDLFLIVFGLALLLFAPLALRLDPPRAPVPPSQATHGGVLPRHARFADTDAFKSLLADPRGRQQLEAIQARGGPEPGDVIVLSSGKRLMIV